MRRLPLLFLAAVLVPAPAEAARLPGPLVALAAGPGTAYAVVATRSRTAPFRVLRSGGRRVTALGAFGSRGARFADVAAGPAGPVTVFGRPASSGFAYLSSDGVQLGEGTGPPVLTVAGDARHVSYPDEDGNVAVGEYGSVRTLSGDGPLVRHSPIDALDGAAGPLVLDVAQSARRTELRVIGPGGPRDAVAATRGRGEIEATIARDDTHLFVAYRIGNRLTLAAARATLGARWSRKRLRVKGDLNGAPAIARVGLRTFVASSQRRSIYLTTAGPSGTFTDRLTRPRGSDLAPLAASGPDGRVYVAWTRRTNGSKRRTAVLRRVL